MIKLYFITIINFKMLAWNSPYVLAIIIGLIAVGIYHFDQKQKKMKYKKYPMLKYLF